MSFLIDSYHIIVSVFWSHGRVVTHLSRCVTAQTSAYKFIHVFKHEYFTLATKNRCPDHDPCGSISV